LSGWESIGVILGFSNIVLAILIAAALPRTSKAGGGAAATIYLIVALANAVWIARSAVWPQ